MINYVNSAENQHVLDNTQKNFNDLTAFFAGSVSEKSVLLVVCADRSTLDKELKTYDEKGSHLVGVARVGFIFYYTAISDFDGFKANFEILDNNHISLFVASSEFDMKPMFEYSVLKAIEDGNSINPNFYVPNKMSYVNIKDFSLLKHLMMYYLKHENFNNTDVKKLKLEKVQEQCKNFALDKVKKEFRIFDELVDVFKYFLIDTGPWDITSGFSNNMNAARKLDFDINKRNLEAFEEMYKNRLDRFLEFNCKISDRVSGKDLDELLSTITDGQFLSFFGKSKLELYKQIVELLKDFKVMESRYKADDVERHDLKVSREVDVFTYASEYLSRHYILDNYIENNKDKKNSNIGKNGYIGYKQSEYASQVIDDIIDGLNNRFLTLKQNMMSADFSKTNNPVFYEGLTEKFAKLFENFVHSKYSNLHKRIIVLNAFLENGEDIFSECSSFAATIKYFNNHPMYFEPAAHNVFVAELVEYVKSALSGQVFNARILRIPNARQIRPLSPDDGLELCLIPSVLELDKEMHYRQSINENAFALINYSSFVYKGFNETIFQYL